MSTSQTRFSIDRMSAYKRFACLILAAGHGRVKSIERPTHRDLLRTRGLQGLTSGMPVSGGAVQIPANPYIRKQVFAPGVNEHGRLPGLDAARSGRFEHSRRLPH